MAVYHGDLAPYTYWYDHPPGGWLQVALLMWLPMLFLDGAPSPVAAHAVMVLVVIATAVMLAAVGRALRLPWAVALVGPSLWLLSPLTMFWSRQFLLDNLVAMWLVAAVGCLVHRSGRLRWAFAAGAATGMAALTKETALLLVPVLLVLLLSRTRVDRRSFAAVAFLGPVVCSGALYLLMAVLKGELFPGPDHVSLLGTAWYQVVARDGSGAVWRLATAPTSPWPPGWHGTGSCPSSAWPLPSRSCRSGVTGCWRWCR